MFDGRIEGRRVKCEKCQGGTMLATKVGRFSPPLVIIGVLLLLLGFAAGATGAAVGLLGFFSGAKATTELDSQRWP